MKDTNEQVFRDKEAYRRERAKLPFPEKVKIVVQLQQRRAPIVAKRGKIQMVWQIPMD